jgi:hypothetical protein
MMSRYVRQFRRLNRGSAVDAYRQSGVKMSEKPAYDIELTHVFHTRANVCTRRSPIRTSLLGGTGLSGFPYAGTPSNWTPA